ncbi:hypothetical protein BDZ91DRAFT_746954 [Kalaharituber pfeilii]|nr:hypothetical protein BDZ91DRAFT_746954 [Kalaharituber pfeilii]
MIFINMLGYGQSIGIGVHFSVFFFGRSFFRHVDFVLSTSLLFCIFYYLFCLNRVCPFCVST